MKGRIFLDTNVLVYLFDRDAPTKRHRTQEILEREAPAGRLAVSTQVLQEFYVSVTRKLAKPLDPGEAYEAIQDLMALPTIQVDPSMILSAISRSRADRLSFWDSLIIESALAMGSSRLYSEDLQDGREIDGLKIENPFR